METPSQTIASADAETQTSKAVPRQLEELLKKFSPHTVYSSPIKADGVTVIPVAEARFGLGFGGGTHRAAEQETDDGYGGGGGGTMRPRGYIAIKNGTVQYRPFLDVTRLALGGMALSGWLAYLWMRFGSDRS